jgi:hypothetical protein
MITATSSSLGSLPSNPRRLVYALAIVVTIGITSSTSVLRQSTRFSTAAGSTSGITTPQDDDGRDTDGAAAAGRPRVPAAAKAAGLELRTGPAQPLGPSSDDVGIHLDSLLQSVPYPCH